MGRGSVGRGDEIRGRHFGKDIDKGIGSRINVLTDKGASVSKGRYDTLAREFQHG
ncbi:hypothetical protein [Crossiella sp. NPDC003009]